MTFEMVMLTSADRGCSQRRCPLPKLLNARRRRWTRCTEESGRQEEVQSDLSLPEGTDCLTARTSAVM